MAFGSAILIGIAAFYNAPDTASLSARGDELAARFVLLERALAHGPYFAGAHFSMVDSVFAPVFRDFDVFETIGDVGDFKPTPKLQAWRARLAQRPSVLAAVQPDYNERLSDFLRQRGSALSRLMVGAGVQTNGPDSPGQTGQQDRISSPMAERVRGNLMHPQVHEIASHP